MMRRCDETEGWRGFREKTAQVKRTLEKWETSDYAESIREWAGNHGQQTCRWGLPWESWSEFRPDPKSNGSFMENGIQVSITHSTQLTPNPSFLQCFLLQNGSTSYSTTSAKAQTKNISVITNQPFIIHTLSTTKLYWPYHLQEVLSSCPVSQGVKQSYHTPCTHSYP